MQAPTFAVDTACTARLQAQHKGKATSELTACPSSMLMMTQHPAQRHDRSDMFTPSPSHKPLKIMVVEDDPGIRHYMEAAIHGQPDLVCVGSFDRIQPSRIALKTSQPDILLLDLGLPDGHGLELITVCKQHNPQCEILVITRFGDDTNIIQCLEAGAQGYILKDAFDPDISRFIAELRQGGSPISPRIGRKLFSLLRQKNASAQPSAAPVCTAQDESNLSSREAEVLNLIARGYSYQEISGHLTISLNTVRTYIKQIYQKLAVRSRGEAVFEAAKMGWLPAQLMRPDS